MLKIPSCPSSPLRQRLSQTRRLSFDWIYSRYKLPRSTESHSWSPGPGSPLWFQVWAQWNSSGEKEDMELAVWKWRIKQWDFAQVKSVYLVNDIELFCHGKDEKDVIFCQLFSQKCQRGIILQRKVERSIVGKFCANTPYIEPLGKRAEKNVAALLTPDLCLAVLWHHWETWFVPHDKANSIRIFWISFCLEGGRNWHARTACSHKSEPSRQMWIALLINVENKRWVFPRKLQLCKHHFLCLLMEILLCFISQIAVWVQFRGSTDHLCRGAVLAVVVQVTLPVVGLDQASEPPVQSEMRHVVGGEHQEVVGLLSPSYLLLFIADRLKFSLELLRLVE